MREEWKNELFQPDANNTPRQLGFPMSTARGRRILGICHDTWKRWEELAETIPEYKLQQIKLKNKSSEFGAIAPITPYQVWVIGKIGEVFGNLPHGLPKKWMAQEYINQKKEEFTRSYYEEEQVRYVLYLVEG